MEKPSSQKRASQSESADPRPGQLHYAVLQLSGLGVYTPGPHGQRPTGDQEAPDQEAPISYEGGVGFFSGDSFL